MITFNPTIAIISLTDHCNYRCLTCKGSSSCKQGDKWTDMPQESVDGIVAAIDRFKRVHLSGEGESIMYPGFSDLLKRLPDGPVYSLSSNGWLLDGAVAEAVAGRIDDLYISLDTVDPELYGKIRKPGNLDRVLSNLEAFNKIRRLKTNVWWCFIGMKCNIAGLIDFIKKAVEYKASGVVLQALNENPELKGQSLVHFPDLLRVEVGRAREAATAAGMPLIIRDPYCSLVNDRPYSPSEYVNRYKVKGRVAKNCTDPWTTLYFREDGTFACCCYLMPRFPIGQSKDFVKLWDGERLESIRRGLLGEGEMNDYCRACPEHGATNSTELKQQIAEFIKMHKPGHWKP